MIRKVLGKLFSLFGLLFLVLAGVLYARYGGGADFPDRSGDARLGAHALEPVANLPVPPGNIAVSADGRVFVSLHPEGRPQDKVVEIINGEPRPWPNPAFQDGNGEPRYFRSVLSLRIDRQGRLWTLDYGHHGLADGRLLAFNIESGEVVHEFVFPSEIAGLGSHLNDFQVSPDGQHIYIAEASFFAKTPALIHYDVGQQVARRLLAGHPSVTAEHYTPVVQGRRMVAFGLVAVRPGVDSIALDAQGEWLYFAPVTNLNLYRARTADLRNPSLSAAELADRVEIFAPKTMSDGLTMDRAGNIYLSDLEHSAIVVLRPDKTMETLVRDSKLRWPDGFGFGPDRWLYVTCSALHHVIGRAPWAVKDFGPYQVFRLRADHEGFPGH